MFTSCVKYSTISFLHLYFRPPFIPLNSFSIDKMDNLRSYQINFNLVVCIDDSCNVIDILSNLLVPIQLCNTDGTLGLPGGSIAEYLNQLPVAGITGSAVDLVLDSLGIKVCELLSLTMSKVINVLILICF